MTADASLAQALATGHVDHAVHALLLLLDSPISHQRWTTLDQAVARVRELQQLQRSVSLHAGLAADDANAPLSYAQLQMLTLQTLAPESTAYNIVKAVRVANATPFDPVALRATCTALLATHAVLRTVFGSSGTGEPTQKVLPLTDISVARLVTVLDVDAATYDSDMALAAFVRRATSTPFHLADELPIKVYAVTSATRWALVVVMHHIVTDPESSGVFWSDFKRLYATYCSRPLDHGELQTLQQVAHTCVSYRDFAAWQRRRLASGLLTTSLEYWIHQLSHREIPPLELPFDRPRAAASLGDRRGSTVVFQSTSALEKAFTNLCVTQSASLFIGLLSVFHMLLSRLSHCDDIVIGAPTSGRSHDALAGLMGYFVQTLPFRIQSKDDCDFVAFLDTVKNVVVDGFTHMDIPLQKMLEHVSLERSAAQTSVFSVMFAWENNGSSPETQPRTMETTDLELPHETAKFDIMLSMRYAKNAANETVLEGTLEYPTDVFDRETIERFTQYFLELATQVTQTPHGRKLSEIQMIPSHERQVLLRDWGHPPVVTEATPAFLDERLYQQVQQTPTNVALHFEGQSWTYEQLWHHSSQLAVSLQAAATGSLAGSRVGLFLDRGLENIAAIVSVLQCRAVFIPLDSEFPVDRIQYMLENSEADVVITQRHLVAKLEQLLPPQRQIHVVVCEDAFENTEFASAFTTTQSDVSDAADTIAYLLYTSGSTGRPKGVMVTHANLLTTLDWTVREYNVTPDDLFLQSTSSTLDGSLTQLFSPLLVGASAVITKKNGLHDLAYLSRLLTTHRITFCVFVPSYFAMLIDYMGEFPSYVKHVVLAGEAFPTALATKFYDKHARVCDVTHKRMSPTCLVNEYGPTEASVTSTFYRFPCDLASSGRDVQSIPIGRGIDDHFLVVLDKHKRLVPVNVPGELYVGGRGVAKGYWNRPELTEASFHHDALAWLHERGEMGSANTPLRWYKTGDRVKWLASGELLFLGRTDSQVKLRGMRIELHEVRNVVLQSPRVKDAEVLVVNERLVAFVILVASAAPRVIAELRESVGRRLPVHMVPHQIVVVDQWPRTPNGKLDLRALANVKAPEATTSNQQDGHSVVDADSSGHSSVAVGILKQAWREVLNVDDENVLLRSSFFELGGNSLSAIRVISLVKPHGLSLKLESFFRCKTLVETAAACASTLTMDSAQPTVIPLNWKPRADGTADTPPLFLVHCADGTVWKLMELARRLPFPVFGLQATHSGTAASVEALAATYWDAIQSVQRVGPYRIGGFSFGCRIAHAIALLARQQGAPLAPLTLLDGVPFCYENRPKELRPEETEDETETTVTAYVAKALGYTPSFEQPQDGAGRADHTRDPERELFDQLVTNYTSHCALDRLYRSCASGQKEDTLVSATLFKTGHWTVDTDAYRERGIELDVVPVPGEHLTMLRMPHVESVATAVQAALDV